MKKLLSAIMLSGCLFAMASCGDSDDNSSYTYSVTINESTQTNQNLWADEEAAENISFTTSGAWTSEIIYTPAATSYYDEWLRLSSTSGTEAGDYTISINFSPNTTGIDRTAEIRIICGMATENIIISQSGLTSQGHYKESTFVTFDDTNFENYCINYFDTNGDGKISLAEAEAVTNINVTNLGIASLACIEHFPALKDLQCGGNQLSTLDVSKNSALEMLICDGNQLSTLDVSKNTKLASLDCTLNQLTTLVVDKNIALKDLNCGGNQLSTLDVSKNTELTTLACNSNQLSTLDISQNKALTLLHCTSDQLSALDVSQNTKLTTIICGGNLSSLDISKNTELTSITCSGNISSLDVSKNTKLTHLYCYSDQLLTLDVSKNTKLTNLVCYSNQLTTLDVSQNTELTELNCHGNQLSTLDVSKNTALTSLDCTSNPSLTELWIATGQTITTINKDIHTVIKNK